MAGKNSPQERVREQIVIDASNGVVGRIASFAAKQSLLGKKVAIVNCSNALLTGRRRMIISEYHIARVRGGTSMNGPHFPKSSERIMKRTVRGMLSHNQQRGLDALKRIMCYDSVPTEFASAKKISLAQDKRAKTITLNELSGEI